MANICKGRKNISRGVRVYVMRFLDLKIIFLLLGIVYWWLKNFERTSLMDYQINYEIKRHNKNNFSDPIFSVNILKFLNGVAVIKNLFRSLQQSRNYYFEVGW